MFLQTACFFITNDHCFEDIFDDRNDINVINDSMQHDCHFGNKILEAVVVALTWRSFLVRSPARNDACQALVVGSRTVGAWALKTPPVRWASQSLDRVIQYSSVHAAPAKVGV